VRCWAIYPPVLDLFSLARCLARFSFFLARLTSANLSRETGCPESAFIFSGVAFVSGSSIVAVFIISPQNPCLSKGTREIAAEGEHFCSDKIQSTLLFTIEQLWWLDCERLDPCQS
jgi:hypothetical protein